jgi:putative flavoprotein involved in K+ transport
VRRVSGEGWRCLVTTDGPSFLSDNVVVASGTFGRTPYVPDFADRLDPTSKESQRT